MINKVIQQQKEERDYLLNKPYIKRLDVEKAEEYRNSSLIKLLTGPRRSGKSVMALQMLSGFNFAYLNFDDDLLLKDFSEDDIIRSLTEIYGNFDYLLLDEVQNLTGWELWVNKLSRRGRNIVITGSNARMLSRELATSLTGRYLQIDVLPFSFAEMLLSRSLADGINSGKTPTERGMLLNALGEYMSNGGFPEVIMNPDIRINYLSTLFDSLILKDIMKRFQVRQARQLYDLATWLLTNYTNQFTYNQLKTDLQFNSVATVQKFCGYLEEAFLFVPLPRYSTKLRLQKRAPQKSYAIDNGFITARSFEQSPNSGRLLENLVLVELIRRGFQPGLEIFYYRTINNREVDFVLRKGHKVVKLIQVCFDISSPKTAKRELSALTEAAGEFSCDNLQLITWDTEDEIHDNKHLVRMIPAWKWLTDFNDK